MPHLKSISKTRHWRSRLSVFISKASLLFFTSRPLIDSTMCRLCRPREGPVSGAGPLGRGWR